MTGKIDARCEHGSKALADRRQYGMLKCNPFGERQMSSNLWQRRDFITLLGGAVAVWPLAVHAQQQPIRSLAFSAARRRPPTSRLWKQFLMG
jgi:hypothetical protein